jgi:hypothetical protein
LKAAVHIAELCFDAASFRQLYAFVRLSVCRRAIVGFFKIASKIGRVAIPVFHALHFKISGSVNVGSVQQPNRISKVILK